MAPTAKVTPPAIAPPTPPAKAPGTAPAPPAPPRTTATDGAAAYRRSGGTPSPTAGR